MWLPRWYFFLATVSSLLAAQGFAAKKSLDQYWKDVDLKFNFVAPELSSENCYSDERTFLACVYAINSMLGYEKNARVLVSRDRYQSESGFGPVAASFGAVEIVEPQKFESDSTVAIYEHIKQERAKANVAWSALFRARDTEGVIFEDVVAWIKKSPVFTEKESSITASAVNTLLSITRDPHTVLLPSAYVKDESSAGSDDFTGIGVVFRSIREDGHRVIVVEKPVEGSPALKAGLHAGDILVKVDGENVEGKSLEEVSPKILGVAGTQVLVTVHRKSKELTFTVVRDHIVMPNIVEKVLPGNAGALGYVKLGSFLKEDGCEKMKEAVTDLQNKGVKGLILDLRENPGGLLLQAVCIANIFLKKDELVVSTESLSGGFGANRDFRTSDPQMTDLPLVTLINAGSASASELVSGALQDNERAILVGERSFGKGSVQSQAPVSDGKLVLRETIAKFYLPSGRSNQVEGVSPDLTVYRVPNPTAEDKFAMREEDEYMALPPTGPKWKQPRPEVINRLQDCVTTSGTAAQVFAAGNDDAIPPDYQLLVAQDTLHCVSQLGLGGDETHPTWRGLPFSFSWGRHAGERFPLLRKRLADPSIFGHP